MKKKPGRPTGFRQPRRPTRKPLAERGGGDGGGLQNSCRARESNTLFGPACQEKFSPPGTKLLSGRGKRARMSSGARSAFGLVTPAGLSASSTIFFQPNGAAPESESPNA